jgi:hypothetical protein
MEAALKMTEPIWEMTASIWKMTSRCQYRMGDGGLDMGDDRIDMGYPVTLGEAAAVTLKHNAAVNVTKAALTETSDAV